MFEQRIAHPQRQERADAVADKLKSFEKIHVNRVSWTASLIFFGILPNVLPSVPVKLAVAADFGPHQDHIAFRCWRKFYATAPFAALAHQLDQTLRILGVTGGSSIVLHDENGRFADQQKLGRGLRHLPTVNDGKRKFVLAAGVRRKTYLGLG